jgi:hypothetical protein
VLENWVDIVIVFLLAAYALQGLQRGFVLGLLDLKPIAFLGLWVLSDVLVTLVLRVAALPLRLLARMSSLNGMFGLLPGLMKGGLVVALVLALALALPLPEPVRAQITGSAVGGRLAGELGPLESTLRDVFADAVMSGIAVATIHPQADERVELQFKVAEGRVDEEAEARMLKLLNDERAQAGLPAVKLDAALTEAARAHSRDMLAKGYFAHQNTEGKSIAHQGLMKSPGHRENIMSPQYHRVGIGVVDGGLHGKMFTQDFAD